MAEHRRESHERTAVAVAEAPSATEAYLARAQELREEEGRLSTLTNRQAAGERLTRDEIVDKLMLEQTVAQLQHEVAARVKPMQDEQLQLDIADVIEVHNGWAATLEHAFAQWVSTLSVPYQATQDFLALLGRYSAALASMPAFQHVGETPPDGRALLDTMLSTLPEALSWKTLLLSPHVRPVSVHDARQMQAACTPAHPQQEQHLARRVQMRRSQR